MPNGADFELARSQPAYTARSSKAWRRFKYYVLALSDNQLTAWADRKLMRSQSANSKLYLLQYSFVILSEHLSVLAMLTERCFSKKVGLSTNLLGWISFQWTMTLKFYLFNAILNTTTVFQATTSCVFPTATKNSNIG